MARTAALLNRLLPRSLLGRVMLLYSVALVSLVALGFGAFLAFEINSKVNDAEQGAMALSALVVPAVSEAALIGDYDTIKRTLERCIDHPLFERASFIDLKGGRLEVQRHDRPSPIPPAWLTDWVRGRLDVVNAPVVVGGRDYGITRLTYWDERIAADIWQVLRLATGLALAGILFGSALVWWPLKRWLGQLDRVQALSEQLQHSGQAINPLEEDQAPLEFQKTFAVLNRVAASLQTERAQAAVTLASIAEGVATLNRDGEIVLANPVLGDLLQRPSAALLGLRLTGLLPELGFKADPGELWRDRRVRLTGGADRTLEGSLATVETESGEPAGWVLTLRDVTQQQQLEDQLRAELASRAQAMRAMSETLGHAGALVPGEERSDIERLTHQVGELVARLQRQADQLNAIFSLSPDGFVSFDAERRVQFVSPAFAALTGLSATDIVGRDEAQLEALLRAGQAEVKNQAPLSLVELHGAQRFVPMARPRAAVLAFAVHAGAGREVSQVLHVRDATQQFEVDRLKSEFLTTAAHELRTPMTSVYGFTEVLLMRELPAAKQREVLQRIHRQSQAMMEILNELLDLARIEARRAQDFNFRGCDLRELVRQAVEDFQPPDGRTPPRLDLRPEAAWVRVDADKLMQTLRNLLSNAYKYSPDGGDVALRLAPDAELGPDWFCLEVQDHGIGMSPEQLARVTERFYRADASGAIPGTGLGMSIVKEIIELHGGRMHLSSLMGQGTTVRVQLPRFTEPAPPPAAAASDAAAAA